MKDSFINPYYTFTLMYTQIAKKICNIKREFAKTYTGNAHIQEVIPMYNKTAFPISSTYIDALCKFTRSNPIYYNYFQQDIDGVLCTIHEGDINEYWLNSIKHGASCQPFYPTWMISAFVLAYTAQSLGCTDLVDIGSGDGRIAFCAAILGMKTHSIEIDDALVQLQCDISRHTNVNFNPICTDALEIKYEDMKLSRPAFVIGGLPQMGGEMFAEKLIKHIKRDCNDNGDRSHSDRSHSNHSHSNNSGNNNNHNDNDSANTSNKKYVIVLAGEAKRSGPAAKRNIGTFGGWDSIINQHNLQILHQINLPTVWTFDQDYDTPYIYAVL